MNSYQNYFKIEVLQYISRGNSNAMASRKFNVHPSTIYAWTQIGMQEFIAREKGKTPPELTSTPNLTFARRIQQLERENAVLRQAAKLYFMHIFNDADDATTA